MLKKRLYVHKLCKFNARILLSLFLTLSFTTIAIAQQCMANCRGDTSIGGPCYAGIGGPAYAGIGGGAYAGIGGPCYEGLGGGANKDIGGGAYAGPGGPADTSPAGGAYAGPGGGCYAGIGGPCYTGIGDEVTLHLPGSKSRVFQIVEIKKGD